MQINPFGFPLGAGMQPAPIFGGANLGFADALGVAIGGGAQPQAAGIGMLGSSLPPSFQTQLTGTLAVQPQAQAAETPLLPGLQQPTPLSQLMATAAKLPTAEQPAATPEAPVAAGEGPADAVVIEFPQPSPAKAAAQPVAAPANNNAPLADAASADNDALPATVTNADAQAELAKPAKPTEATAPRARKGPRIEVPGDTPAQPVEAKAGIPAELLTAIAPQQVAQQQRQVAPSEPARVPEKALGAVAKKSAVAGDAPTQPVATDTTADFARAVAARGDSGAAMDQGDGQSQPEHKIAAAKLDLAAPAMPQPGTAATATPLAAARHATPEPMIEARAGHLGHSLGVEIARKVDMGEETLRVRLNPVELGRVEVTLAFDDRGSLQATVRTESAHALDLLRQDAPDLQRTLDQAGVRTDAQSFRFESRTGDGGGQQAQQQQSQNRGQFASSEDETGAAEAIYRPVRSDGQVDLLA